MTDAPQLGGADARPSVLAVVVCFNPEIEAFKVALAAITKQVDKTVVVDNASHNREQILAIIDDLALGAAVSLLPQSKNIGLGAAHNVGIRYAKDHSHSHVLLLDQDSVPLADMVKNLLAALQKKQGSPVSAVGATYLNADNGSESFFIRFGWFKFQRQYCNQRDADACVKADFLISSGSLFPLKSLEHIGYMDETLFIDHVDTEWFLRARNKGYSSYGVCDAIMQHGLGEQTHRITLGRQRNVPQHKPFRYYYIFRNSVALYRRGYASFLWKWNDIQRLVMIAAMFGIWKAPRGENITMMASGFWDGLRGVSGPKP